MSPDKKLTVVNIGKFTNLIKLLSAGTNSQGRYGKLVPWLNAEDKVFTLDQLDSYVEEVRMKGKWN